MTKSRSLSVFLVLISTAVLAVDLSVPPVQLIPARSRGFVPGTIAAIGQTADGFLWVGTAQGLYRYDGTEFIRYLQAPVTAIANDGDGSLWVGTDARGLYRYRERTWSLDSWNTQASVLAPGLPGSFVPGISAQATITALSTGPDGRIWVGTAAEGVLVINPEDNTATHFRHNPGSPRGLQSDRITAISLDDTSAWVGTADRGLARIDSRTGEIAVFRREIGRVDGFPSDWVTALVSSDEGLWVGTGNAGLLYRDTETGLMVSVSGTSDPVVALTLDRTLTAWVAMSQGVARARSQRGGSGPSVVPLQGIDAAGRSLPQGNPTALFTDASGLIWLAYAGRGLWMYDPGIGSIRPVTSGDSGALGTVWAMAERNDGGVWVVSDRCAVCLYSPANGSPSVVSSGTVPPTTSPIYGMAVDRTDRLWLATDGDGILVLGQSGGLVAHYRQGITPVLPTDRFVSVRILEGGQILFGTVGEGLLVHDPTNGAWTRVPTGDGIVYAITQDSAGRVWIGTDGSSLLEYDPASGIVTPRPVGGIDENDSCWGVSSLGNGELLVSMRRSGALLLDSAGTVTMRWSPGAEVPANTVYAGIADRSGRVWLSTDAGLFLFPPASAGPREVRHFRAGFGLAADEFTLGAMMVARDGTLYIGGADGFVTVDPARVATVMGTSPIAVATVRDSNGLVVTPTTDPPPADDQDPAVPTVVVRSRNGATVVDLTVLDYPGTAMRRFQYMLAGVHAEWIDLRDTGPVILDNLPSGVHRFLARQVPFDGDPGPSLHLLTIAVSLSFLQEAWFIRGAWIAMALVVGATVALLARARNLKRTVIRMTTQVGVLARGMESVAGSDHLTRLVSGLGRRFETQCRIIAAIDNGLLDPAEQAAWGVVIGELVSRAAARFGTREYSDVRPAVIVELRESGSVRVLSVSDNGPVTNPDADEPGALLSAAELRSTARRMGGALVVRTGTESRFGIGTEWVVTL